MKFYKYLLETRKISADDIVLILYKKGSKYLLVKNNGNILLKTKNSDDILNFLDGHTNHNPDNILKVVNKTKKISFVVDKDILKRK